jgi:transcription initiation factor TFIIH subunit 2
MCIDNSASMGEKDFTPTYLDVALDNCRVFIGKFFDQNPISQLGILTTKSGLAQKICDLTGNPNELLDSLKAIDLNELDGEPSIQNLLELALAMFKSLGKGGTRELFIISASLTSCDPGSIEKSIEKMKTEQIRCSVISLTAETFVYKKLVKETDGVMNVSLDSGHFNELLMELVEPPPLSVKYAEKRLTMMGFPVRLCLNSASLCVCHQKLMIDGYQCPRCFSHICDIPSECLICGLKLISSPHLSRSYHYLFPVVEYSFIENQVEKKDTCFSCSSASSSFRCEECKKQFCEDCDTFIHEVLHNCPGCV